MTQSILAENVKVLRDLVYAHLPNATERNKALAIKADTSLSQIQRIIAEDVAPGIDIVERIAIALGTRPQDLLTPQFARTVRTIPAAEVPAPGKQATTVHEPTASYPPAGRTRSSGRKT